MQQQSTRAARQRFGRRRPVGLADDSGIVISCACVHRPVVERRQVVCQHLRRHIPSGRATPGEPQRIARTQQVELVKEHLALTFALGAHGHMQHRLIALQVQPQGALTGPRQKPCVVSSSLRRGQNGGIGTDQALPFPQREQALILHLLNLLRIECSQGRDMQFGARFGQGPVGDMAQQASVAALTAFVGKETVDLALHAGTAKTAKGPHQRRHGQFARMGECGEEIGATGRSREGRAVKVFGQSGQNSLDKITVLMQKSCQPQENNQLNQQIAYSTGVSLVNWLLTHMNERSALHRSNTLFKSFDDREDFEKTTHFKHFVDHFTHAHQNQFALCCAHFFAGYENCAQTRRAHVTNVTQTQYESAGACFEQFTDGAFKLKGGSAVYATTGTYDQYVAADFMCDVHVKIVSCIFCFILEADLAYE
jgi:hypothetical protein